MNLVFEGFVEKGEGMARGLGCPTANLEINEGSVIPGLGVYVGETEINGEQHPSVVCINDGRQKLILKIEVHLLNKEIDLLGKFLKVQIFEKIRDLVDWQGEEEMKKMIAKDLKDAEGWFENGGRDKYDGQRAF